MDWENKHIFVTGAAKRVARGIVEKLLSRPIRLSAHYHRSKEEAQTLQRQVKERGSECQILQGDLSEAQTAETLAREAQKNFGPVDILILSASNFFKSPLSTSFHEALQQWDSLHAVNARSTYLLIHEFAKTMPKGGVILTIGDVNGSRPVRDYSAYCSAKAALLMLTRNFAEELAPQIRVNSISPGPVLVPENYSEEKKAASARGTLLGRWGSPEDIAEAVTFLLGNDYITGFDLKVDGGRSLSDRQIAY